MWIAFWKSAERPEMVSNGNIYQQVYIISHSLFPWTMRSTLEQKKGNTWLMTKKFPHYITNHITQKHWDGFNGEMTF